MLLTGRHESRVPRGWIAASTAGGGDGTCSPSESLYYGSTVRLLCLDWLEKVD